MAITISTSQPSHRKLLKEIKREFKTRKKVLIQFGRSKGVDEEGYDLVINTSEGIDTARNKLKMKEKFAELNIPSPTFFRLPLTEEDANNLRYPLYAKRQFRSRGIGMQLLQSKEELDTFLSRHVVNNNYFQRNNYYLEVGCNYTREYGIHVSTDGVFHMVRKMLKADAEKRWFRNSENCVFFLPDNPQFGELLCFDAIQEAAVLYLNSTGLSFGRFDVLVNRTGTNFKFIEVNSAMSVDADGVFGIYKNEILKKLVVCAD